MSDHTRYVLLFQEPRDDRVKGGSGACVSVFYGWVGWVGLQVYVTEFKTGGGVEETGRSDRPEMLLLTESSVVGRSGDRCLN